MRQQSPWLIFWISVMIFVPTVGLTLFGPAVGAPSAMESETMAMAAAAQTLPPQACGSCHPDEFQEWSHSTHANASFDPIFQVYLQGASQPGECFACHTTGYNTLTGQFVLAGVSCEACHGPYRAEHPADSMLIARSEEMCGACHRSTLAEWEMSRHGVVGVTCIDCHEVHSQRTREASITNVLCAECHAAQLQNETHVQHVEAVPCIECHLARPANLAEGAVSGKAETGHSFTVQLATCTACHANQFAE